MAKRIIAFRIKKHLTYTATEAAEQLNVSVATIRNWIKAGLPIQKDQRPFLIFGSDLRDFIIAQRNKRKFTLKDDELSCFKCSAGRQPHEMAVQVNPQTAKTSRLDGICSNCYGRSSRVISNARMAEFASIFQFATTTLRHPNGDPRPPLEMTLH